MLQVQAVDQLHAELVSRVQVVVAACRAQLPPLRGLQLKRVHETRLRRRDHHVLGHDWPAHVVTENVAQVLDVRRVHRHIRVDGCRSADGIRRVRRLNDVGVLAVAKCTKSWVVLVFPARHSLGRGCRHFHGIVIGG